MKGPTKLMLIPLFIGIIAGLTYLVMDSFLGFDMVERNDYNKELDRERVEGGERLEEDSLPTESLKIAHIIRREEDKLRSRFQSSPQLKLGGGSILKWFEGTKGDSSEKEPLKKPFLDIDSKDIDQKLRDNKVEEFDSDKIVIRFGEGEYVGEENLEGDKGELRDQSSKDEGEIIVLRSSGEDEDDEEDKEVKNSLYIGIKDGYLAIYRGEILGEKELIEVKEDIPVEGLSGSDKENLTKGIEVKDKEELLSLLEGFVSAIEE